MYICAKVYTDLHIVMAELSFVNPPILPVRFIAHPSLPPDPYIPLLGNKCPAISENALTTPLTRVSSWASATFFKKDRSLTNNLALTEG